MAMWDREELRQRVAIPGAAPAANPESRSYGREIPGSRFARPEMTD
jgi:hypothetical protein